MLSGKVPYFLCIFLLSIRMMESNFSSRFFFTEASCLLGK